MSSSGLGFGSRWRFRGLRRIGLVGLSRCRLLRLLRSFTTWRGLSLTTVGGGPESEIVAEKLHDESAVTVGLLGKRVELSDGIIKSLLSKMASTIG